MCNFYKNRESIHSFHLQSVEQIDYWNIIYHIILQNVFFNILYLIRLHKFGASPFEKSFINSVPVIRKICIAFVTRSSTLTTNDRSYLSSSMSTISHATYLWKSRIIQVWMYRDDDGKFTIMVSLDWLRFFLKNTFNIWTVLN